MNRPSSFGRFSLFWRRSLSTYLPCIVLLFSLVTVNSEQLQGCSLDNTLCENDEICLADGLFGQCYSGNSESIPIVINAPLTDIQKDVLQLQLSRLAEEQLNWPDAQSQCVLAYFKLVVAYQLEYDADFCGVRNPANIWALVQRVQNILSDTDGVLTQDELMLGQDEARNLIDNALANVEAADAMPVDQDLMEVPEEIEAVAMAEPALLIDPESQMALPVIIVDEEDEGSDDFLSEPSIGNIPVQQILTIAAGPLTVNGTSDNETETVMSPVEKKALTEESMNNNEEVQDLLREYENIINSPETPVFEAPQAEITPQEKEQLNSVVLNIAKGQNSEDQKLTASQQVYLSQIIYSLQNLFDKNLVGFQMPSKEVEEAVPQTSLDNEQQLMLKKDAEEYHNDDMGLANTVHKIVKGDFQRVEGNRVYIRLSKEGITEEEMIKLIEFLDAKIASPNDIYFDDFKYADGELSFRIIRLNTLKPSGDKRMESASGVAQAVYKRRKDIQTLSGVQVAETGIGSGEDAVPVERSGRDWFFVPILGICAFTITTLFAVLAVHLVRNRKRNFKTNLPEVIDHLEGGKSALAYEELCRQRAQETPTSINIGGAAVSKTSSTSSWPDESLIQSCNLDISTGHATLTFLKEHLENPNKIEEQWKSVSDYFNSNAVQSVGFEPQNVNKNRDRKVIPYDENVVMTNSGYYNASKIHDSDPRHCLYIVAQAPSDATLNTYWQMIWEEGVALIVNLCQIDECDKYWPDEGTAIYDNYEVNLVSEHIWSEDYVVRSFYLKSLTTNETRTVTQFHFLSWKKNQVPSSNKSLLEFRKKVNKSYRGRASPVLVHDLNGSGRAGTYCLIDLVVNRIAKGVKEIDMEASLEHLRDQRPFLVEDLEQYKMVFSCVAEEVTTMIKSIQH